MANSGLTAATFLDALVLLLVSSTEPTEENANVFLLVDSLCNAYAEDVKPTASTESILDRNFIKLIRDVRLIEKGKEHDVERSKLVIDFIQKNKPIDGENEIFIESLKQIFEDAKKAKFNKEVQSNIKKRIRNALTWSKYKKLLNQMYGKLNRFDDTTDNTKQAEVLAEINTIAKQLVEGTTFNLDDLPTDAEERVVLSDKNSLNNALIKLKEEEDTGILKTGLQGLNRMLGKRGGFARGEFAVIYGLQHHFKTGLLLTIARGICKYNSPKAHAKDGKKPLILFISLENYARKNLFWFYKTAYACCKQCEPDPNMPTSDMIKFVQEWYVSTGWEFIIERYQGKSFSYEKFTETIERYEALGYEVVAVLLDYMEKMAKSRNLDKNNSEWLNLGDLTNNIFGYIKSKEILFITPHQFNRDMSRIAEQGKTNVVKHFGTSGVSGSVEVARVVDLEISVYIEEDHKKQSWLTVQRGKHRYVDDTPKTHRYFAYKFDEKLGILDDYGTDENGKPKEAKFVTDIYAIDTGEDGDGVTKETVF